MSRRVVDLANNCPWISLYWSLGVIDWSLQERQPTPVRTLFHADAWGEGKSRECCWKCCLFPLLSWIIVCAFLGQIYTTSSSWSANKWAQTRTVQGLTPSTTAILRDIIIAFPQPALMPSRLHASFRFFWCDPFTAGVLSSNIQETMDHRKAWRAAVYRATKGRMLLNDWNKLASSRGQFLYNST